MVYNKKIEMHLSQKEYEIFKGYIEETGDELFPLTKRCYAWKLSHNRSCRGCSSQLGCLKLTLLQFLHLVALPPNRIERVWEYDRWLYGWQERILQARNLEELGQINQELYREVGQRYSSRLCLLRSRFSKLQLNIP